MSWAWKKDLRFKNDAEVWENYSEEQNAVIETAYEKKETSVSLDKKYNIDFKAMVQHRSSDWDRQRPVRRKEVAYWMWKNDLRLKDDKGEGWTKYEPAISEQLEQAYQKDKTQDDYDLDKKYSLDFGDMVQYRKGDKFRQRPIKRVSPGEADDGGDDGSDEDKATTRAADSGSDVGSSDDEETNEPPKKKTKQMSALEMLVTATSGAVGGYVSKTATYPLERIKLVLMGEKATHSLVDVLRKVKQAGWYNGLSAKLSKSVSQRFIYFYFYEALSQFARWMTLAGGKGSLSTAVRLLVGYWAEIFAVPFFAPLEMIQVQMTIGPGNETMVGVFLRVLKDKGIMGFYGAWDGYMMGAIQPAIVYTVYEKCKALLLGLKAAKMKQEKDKRPYSTNDNHEAPTPAPELTALESFCLGVVSRSVGLSIAHPLNLGRTLVQAGKRHPQTGVPITSVVSAMVMVLQYEGVRGLVKGLGTDLIQGTLDTAIMLMIKERAHQSVRAFMLLLVGLVWGTKRT